MESKFWYRLIRLSCLLVATLVSSAGQPVSADQTPTAGAVSEAEEEEYGAASRKVIGELVAIEGEFFVVRDSFGREIRLHVSQLTDRVRKYKPGDHLEIYTSPIEHAMFIKAAKPGLPVPGESAAPSKTVRGELVAIEGQYYVIKDELGHQVRLFVSRDTEMAGAFKPGDLIEAQTSPLEHAVSIERAED